MEREILQANETFYRAFRETDLELLRGLWSRQFPVTCIHPGGPPHAGYDAVIDSWRQVFSGLTTPRLLCQRPTVRRLDGIAIVTCVEVLENGRFAATNLFVREDSQWQMVHHQASEMRRARVDRAGDAT
jgi:hypothetical protein